MYKYSTNFIYTSSWFVSQQLTIQPATDLRIFISPLKNDQAGDLNVSLLLLHYVSNCEGCAESIAVFAANKYWGFKGGY